MTSFDRQRFDDRDPPRVPPRLLRGNEKFFNRFGETRREFLIAKLDAVAPPDSPLSGDDDDMSPLRKLRFFSEKLEAGWHPPGVMLAGLESELSTS